uniref:DUF1294 domain-containing protein n=1 Tax=Ningiella ruwaisensis TaxID=2364274 RepID=UPI0010A0B110|nr:cold shock and DUF1294 domain-containing protein [Ningiella ruwaisensis]
MRFQGKLSNWNDEKGFGFVEPNGGGNRAFVHIKSFAKSSRRPVEGDILIYEQTEEQPGKFKALNVTLAADNKRKKNDSRAQQYKSRRSSKRTLEKSLSLSFCLIIFYLVMTQTLPKELFWFLIGANVLTFIFYWIDKRAAQHRQRRVPEANLHMMSLLGAWPSALLAQLKLRHKSSKAEFLRVYRVTIAVNIAAVFWLFSEQGNQFLSIFGIK